LQFLLEYLTIPISSYGWYR